MLILNPHTSMNHFVRYTAYLIFLIILQEGKNVNTFCKKCLHFYNNRGKIVILRLYSSLLWLNIMHLLHVGEAPQQNSLKKMPIFPLKSRLLHILMSEKKFIFAL